MASDDEPKEVRAKVRPLVAVTLEKHAEAYSRYGGSREKLIAEILDHWYEEAIHASRLTINLARGNGDGKA